MIIKIDYSDLSLLRPRFSPQCHSLGAALHVSWHYPADDRTVVTVRAIQLPLLVDFLWLLNSRQVFLVLLRLLRDVPGVTDYCARSFQLVYVNDADVLFGILPTQIFIRSYTRSTISYYRLWFGFFSGNQFPFSFCFLQHQSFSLPHSFFFKHEISVPLCWFLDEIKVNFIFRYFLLDLLGFFFHVIVLIGQKLRNSLSQWDFLWLGSRINAFAENKRTITKLYWRIEGTKVWHPHTFPWWWACSSKEVSIYGNHENCRLSFLHKGQCNSFFVSKFSSIEACPWLTKRNLSVFFCSRGGTKWPYKSTQADNKDSWELTWTNTLKFCQKFVQILLLFWVSATGTRLGTTWTRRSFLLKRQYTGSSIPQTHMKK